MAEPARENSGDAAEVRTIGRPFEKGKSGNPKGRPQGLAKAVRELAKGLDASGDPALGVAKLYMQFAVDPKFKPELRMAALDRLAERGWGKAPQYAPVEDDDPLGMTDQDLDEAVGRFDAEVVRLAVAPGAGSAANGRGAQGEDQR